MRTVIFRVVRGVAAMIVGRKEKPITSITGIFADINGGNKMKKVLKLLLILHTFSTTSVAKKKKINNPHWQVLRLYMYCGYRHGDTLEKAYCKHEQQRHRLHVTCASLECSC